MIVPSSIRTRFREIEPSLDVVATKVRDAVLRYCDQRGYAFIGRKKNLDSLAEKLESGRFESWATIDDLYACTVIIPTLNEEQEVIGFLSSTFQQVNLKSRGDTFKPPDVFRFEATRFIGRLRLPLDPEHTDASSDILFEVQVRSAFEHAWSAAPHSLVYKSGTIDWKKQRLAASLKAAVEQLDTAIVAFDSTSEPIIEHVWPEIRSKISIHRAFQELVEHETIPAEHRPKDWSRFADNFYSLICASNGVSRDARSRDELVKSAIEVVTGYLQNTPSKQLPRSLSFLQIVLGVLIEKRVLRLPLKRYSAVVTDELIQLFPATKRIAQPFVPRPKGASEKR